MEGGILNEIIAGALGGILAVAIIKIMAAINKKIPWKKLWAKLKKPLSNIRQYAKIKGNHIRGVYSIEELVKFDKMPREKLTKKQQIALDREREILVAMCGGELEEAIDKMVKFNEQVKENSTYIINQMLKNRF